MALIIQTHAIDAHTLGQSANMCHRREMMVVFKLKLNQKRLVRATWVAP
jgi:hypothetical protein